MNIFLKIEKATFGGQGLGFHQKKAIFVANTLPEDYVEIEITTDKKDFSIGKLIQIIEPSPLRIEPACPNFGKCGGCSYLNTSYENELQIKKDIFCDTLRRCGSAQLLVNQKIEIIAAERHFYRSHATVKIDENLHCGFFAAKTNSIIPFPPTGCLLLAPELNKALLENNQQATELKVAVNDQGKLFSSLEKNNDYIEETIEGISYSRKIGNFFQANRYLRSKMIELMLEYTEANKNTKALDIGCGTGFFTLPLAKICQKVTGFDIDKNNIELANFNKQKNNLTNCNFIAATSDKIHPFREKYDLVVADPPRAGLTKKTRKTVLAIAPKIFVYISCNPATFARDAQFFTENNYSLERITLLDMFPATSHIEVIAKFTLNS